MAVLCGGMALRKVFDDAVELFVCGVRCIHPVFHAVVCVVHNLAECLLEYHLLCLKG